MDWFVLRSVHDTIISSRIHALAASSHTWVSVRQKIVNFQICFRKEFYWRNAQWIVSSDINFKNMTVQQTSVLTEYIERLSVFLTIIIENFICWRSKKIYSWIFLLIYSNPQLVAQYLLLQEILNMLLFPIMFFRWLLNSHCTGLRESAGPVLFYTLHCAMFLFP